MAPLSSFLLLLCALAAFAVGEVSIAGVPAFIAVNLLCPSPTSVRFPLSHRLMILEPIVPSFTLSPPGVLLSNASIRLNPVPPPPFFSGSVAGATLWLPYYPLGQVCIGTLADGSLLEIPWEILFDLSGGGGPGILFRGPAPSEAMASCIRKVQLEVFDRFPVPLVTNASLVTTATEAATGAVSRLDTPVFLKETACDGVSTYASPPPALAAAPGTVVTDPPFLIYADEGCAPLSTHEVFADLVIPVDDLREVLAAYDIACGRSASSPATAFLPIPRASARCVVAIVDDRSGFHHTASIVEAYSVFLTGCNISVPVGGSSIDVSWTFDEDALGLTDPFPYAYSTICKASSSSLGVDGTAVSYELFYSEPLRATLLQGPAPAWAFEACLRSLVTAPSGMPDGLGSFFLNVTAQTRTLAPPDGPPPPVGSGLIVSAPLIVPFEEVYPCPTSPRLQGGEERSPRLFVSPASAPPHPHLDAPGDPDFIVEWRAHCADALANATHAFATIVSDLLEGLIASSPALGIVASANVSYACANCVFPGARVRTFEGPDFSFADTLSLGHLAYLPGGLNAKVLPQRLSFPNITVRGVTFSSASPAYGGTPVYASCSSSFPSLDRLPQSVSFSRIVDSTGDTTASPDDSASTFGHWLGNPATAAIYPPCYAATVGFFPFFYSLSESFWVARNLSMGTTAGNYSFTITVEAHGFEVGLAAFHGAPLVTKSASASVLLVVSNEDCIGRPLSALSITPTLVHPELAWDDANCTAAKIPLFLSADLSFAVDALEPPTAGAPPPPTPEAFTGGVQITCVNGTCPLGLLYFTPGAIPSDSLLRPLVSWSYSGGCNPAGACFAACTYKSGTEFGAPEYTLLMPSLFFYTAPPFTGFNDTNPALLSSVDWTPSTAFEYCLKDLFLVHGPSAVSPSVPAPPFKSSVDLVITAIRSDMVRITARNASLRIEVPSSFDCPATSGERVSSSSVAKVVVPSVVVPVCAAVIAVAVALVVIEKSKKARSTSAIASAGHGGAAATEARHVELVSPGDRRTA